MGVIGEVRVGDVVEQVGPPAGPHGGVVGVRFGAYVAVEAVEPVEGHTAAPRAVAARCRGVGVLLSDDPSSDVSQCGRARGRFAFRG